MCGGSESGRLFYCFMFSKKLHTKAVSQYLAGEHDQFVAPTGKFPVAISVCMSDSE